MTDIQLMLHEAKLEIKAGFKSGIVYLAFWGLVLYLLLSIANADNMQQMGAADIPRNSASIIYLMGAGCMFFQYFAWAWIFAQPALRDQKAHLHEVVLSSPTSLSALLWGRFLGAAVIGAILGAAALAGFLFAPVLVWAGIIPENDLVATPWGILTYAWLWLIVPASIGIGAIYFIVSLRTRSIGGAFALAAAFMLLWMFAIVVLMGGGMSSDLATIVDPSLFSFAYEQNSTWTPAQKTSSLLPFTTASIINRIIWCLLPLGILAWYLSRVTRESLVLERSAAKAKPQPTNKIVSSAATAAAMTGGISPQLPALPSPLRSLHQLYLETKWRLRQIITSKGWLIGVAVLAIMGVVSSFTHVIWHADGPMAPTIELLLPLLKESLYLFIAFVVAAMVGLVYRRDNVPGFDDMLHATPVPSYVPAMSLCLVVVIITVLMSLVPGISGATAVLLSGAGDWPIIKALSYQLLIVAVPMLEIAMIALLVHALLRHAGLAYALSMLITFILVLNHELNLVSYPPYELGITPHTKVSALDGWSPWLDYLLSLNGFKLGLGMLFAGIAALFYPRGHDSRLARGFEQIRSRLLAPEGLLVAVALIALIFLGGVLDNRLVALGGYQSDRTANVEDLAWEKNVAPNASGFSVGEGSLELTLDTKSKVARGNWQLDQVITTTGNLPFELSHGFELIEAKVDGKTVEPKLQHGHMTIPLNSCNQPSCSVTLSWQAPLSGWSAEGDSMRISDRGVWLRANDLVPSLGFDPERFVRTPSIRQKEGFPEDWPKFAPDATAALSGVAPMGNWRWQVIIDDGKNADVVQQGEVSGPLDFSLARSPKLAAKTYEKPGKVDPLTVSYDSGYAERIATIASDVNQMRACVHKRLGGYVPIRRVTPWPRGLGGSRVTGDELQLAENPHWDIADTGTGRWLRKVAIARTLASHYITTTAALRRVPGALWLSDGVAGAIGLLCVGELDGITALNQVLVRYADRTTRNLSISVVPVTTLAAAPIGDWSEFYAPMAALNWTMRQTPGSLSELLSTIRARGTVADVLAEREGEAAAALMLGAPLSSTLEVKQLSPGNYQLKGERWRWQKGGWESAKEDVAYRFINSSKDVGLSVAVPEASADGAYAVTKALALDDWPSFPRDPKQNLIDSGEKMQQP